jgi:hypothetical protein
MRKSALHTDSNGTYWTVTSIADLSVPGGTAGARLVARHLLRFAADGEERFVTTRLAHWSRPEILDCLFDAAKPAAIDCVAVAA